MLTRLIAFDAEGRAIWPVDNLQMLLHEQLASHWQRSGARDQRLRSLLMQSAECAIGSFHDLLQHPRPPIDLLRQTKDIAKQWYQDPGSGLPPEICLVLYYGSIVAAMVRHNERISRLSDDDLRSGASWVARQPWVDAETQGLFRQGLEHLRSGRQWWRK
ncbi:MAG: hypothetical protein ACM359_19900 [Bacillota bacterium]